MHGQRIDGLQIFYSRLFLEQRKGFQGVIMLADGSELHDTQLGGDAGGKTRYDPDADVKK